jgi:2-polyprenyl-6-methoxyphenol hydroxylase-like FAD-dependent oxidoreductase
MGLKSAVSETEVFIVGAGPSGLVAGLQLAAWGVDFRIIDSKETFSENSRAVGIQPRSLEIFEQMGLVADFLAKGRKAVGVDFHTGRRVVEINLFSAGEGRTAYPFLLLLEQGETEKIFHSRLLAEGHEVEWGTEVIGVEVQEDTALLTLKKKNGEETVRTRWLIAADGAKSFVRHAMGIPFAGSTYEQRYAVVDVKSVEGKADRNHLNLNLNRAGFILLLPLSRTNSYRLITTFPPFFEDGGRDPGFEDIQRHVAGLFPGGLHIAEPRWYSNFRIHSRRVGRFQHGPVFFVGDAAHVHSPVGAQGMNTGIQDSYNLAWKLAMVIKGFQPAAILESYNQERSPVAQALLNTTDRVFRLINRRGWFFGIFRTNVYPDLIKLLSSLPAARSRLFEAVSQLGIRYSEGLLVADGGEGFPSKAPRPGERLPYFSPHRDFEKWSSYTLFNYRRYHLLMFVKGREVDAAVETKRAVEREFDGFLAGHVISLQDEISSSFGDLRCDTETFDTFRSKSPASYIVRPDTYVALRRNSADSKTIQRILRSYFGWATPSA